MITLPQKPSSALQQVGKLLIVGFAFLLCISASEYLLVPQAIEPVARLIYRIVYFIVLPVRVLVIPFLPAQEHHWTVLHTVTVRGNLLAMHIDHHKAVARTSSQLRLVSSLKAPGR